MLPSQEECLTLLEQIRWGGVPKCPYCESTNSANLKKEQRYHCNNCFTSYSVTVGTLFHKTHVDLAKWIAAIHLVMNKMEPISIRNLAKRIGVSKNTADYMIFRIRRAQKEEPELLRDVFEYTKKLE